MANDDGETMNKEYVFPPTSQAEHQGMSLRDWFASVSLLGMLIDNQASTKSAEGLAASAYYMAEKMMKERMKS